MDMIPMPDFGPPNSEPAQFQVRVSNKMRERRILRETAKTDKAIEQIMAVAMRRVADDIVLFGNPAARKPRSPRSPKPAAPVVPSFRPTRALKPRKDR